MNKKEKIIITAIAVLFMFTGIAFCNVYFQEFCISIVEKYLGRQFGLPGFWKSVMFRIGELLIISSIIAIWIRLRETSQYQYVYSKNINKIDCYAQIIIPLLTFFVFMVPFIIFGKNSVITIHDNLDGGVAFFHYIHQHSLFWKFNEQVPLFGGTSTVYLNREGFYFYNFLYCLLPTYTGYVINHIVSVILGFVCIFFLQKLLFDQKNLIILTITSLAYAMLPSITVYKMAVATLPFIPILFYKLLTTKENRWIIISFIYPFFSEFSSVGIFVCGFWLIALIVVCINQKKINTRLLGGFILICVGFLICISRLIYMRFAIHEPLNRDFMTVAPASFIRSFITFLFSGYYHSATLQNRLIDWVILIVVVFLLIQVIRKQQQYDKHLRSILFICISVCLFSSFIAALSEAKILDRCIKIIFPPLAGISFTRIYTVARVSCYIAFTASLLVIASNKKYIGIAYGLAVLQLVIVFIGNPLPQNPSYADSAVTWKKNLLGSEDITWKEFYSEDLFSLIKKSIDYKDEPVCAVGYHPSVLLYNDFNTIDGYLSVYPYRQQVIWHELMKPEFERSPDYREYFDSWGGRRYIYNKDLSYEPTREKYHEAVPLFVDMAILKSNFYCKYILSRAELLNASEIGLKHLGTYDSSESIYEIWVYEVL